MIVILLLVIIAILLFGATAVTRNLLAGAGITLLLVGLMSLAWLLNVSFVTMCFGFLALIVVLALWDASEKAKEKTFAEESAARQKETQRLQAEAKKLHNLSSKRRRRD